MRASGMDPEDALQELIITLTARLQGSHPYDPKRGRFAGYCYLLTRSVLVNRVTKRKRRAVGMAMLALHSRDRVAEMDLDAMFPE